MVPDARKAPFPEGPRRRPRYPTGIWLRAGGVWCVGHVHAWVRASGGWVMWVQYRAADVPWPQWEWFAFDPVSVRKRDGPEPPPD